ncbi:MAG: o-succinylbenzoate synthase [SAR202 cluster bacterium]|nr:o-succinylbenzoate synthase [SAR202 cluster bacterium]
MRIDSLDVYHVKMPLIYPWRTSYGEDYDIHSVLVRATSGEHTAWSEVCSLQAPAYLPESVLSVFSHITEFFGPHVVGREYDTADEVNDRLAVFKGNSFAKAGIEECWWTLQTQITGTPLHKLLGGETREVSAGADFGIQDSYDMLLGNIQQAVDAGFPRIKLKVGRGWDLEMLQIVTSTFPDMTFHIDCNSGYTLDDLPFFKAIDPMGLAFIEQPLNYADVIDHAELARQIETPICIDETAVSVKAVEQAIKVGACKYVNIKPGRIGGLANSIKVHDICRDAGIPVWVGGMLESAVGAALCVAIATLPNFTYPGDLFPSSRFYTQDMADTNMVLTPQKTFLPFEGALPAPDAERLASMTVQSKTIVPAS